MSVGIKMYEREVRVRDNMLRYYLFSLRTWIHISTLITDCFMICTNLQFTLCLSISDEICNDVIMLHIR